MHESLWYKLGEDLNLNCDEIESLSTGISNTKVKDIILNAISRQLSSNMKQCETHFKDIFSKIAQKIEK